MSGSRIKTVCSLFIFSALMSGVWAGGKILTYSLTPHIQLPGDIKSKKDKKGFPARKVIVTQSGDLTKISESGHRRASACSTIYFDKTAFYIPAVRDKGMVSRYYYSKVKSPDQIPHFPVILNLIPQLKDALIAKTIIPPNSNPPSSVRILPASHDLNSLQLGMNPFQGKTSWRIYQDQKGFITKFEKYRQDKDKKEILIETIGITKNTGNLPDSVTVSSKRKNKDPMMSNQAPSNIKLEDIQASRESIQLPEAKLIFDVTLLDENDYLNILKSNPADIDALYNLGRLYRQQKKPEKAIQFLRKAWNKIPFNTFVQRELFQIYVTSGKFEEAKAFFAEYENAPQATSSFIRSNGFLYGMTKDWRKEEAYYKKAVDMAKDDQDKIKQLFTLATMYRNRNRFNEAKGALLEIEKLNSDKHTKKLVLEELTKIEKKKVKFYGRNEEPLKKGYEKIADSIRRKEKEISD